MDYKGAKGTGLDRILTYGEQELLYNTYTDTDRTLVIGDAFAGVNMNSSAIHTLTIPPNSSVAFLIGTQILINEGGSGQVTIAPGAGVTIKTMSSLVMGGQNSKGILLKTGTDTWEWTQWSLNLFGNSMSPQSDSVIASNSSVIIPDQFEVPDGVNVEIGDGSILEILA